MGVNAERSEIGEKKFDCYEAWLGVEDGILFGDLENGVFVQLVDNNRISVLDVKDHAMTLFEVVPLEEGEPYGKDFGGLPILLEGKSADSERRQLKVSAPGAMTKKIVRSEHRKKLVPSPI